MSEEDFEFNVEPTLVMHGVWIPEKRHELLKAAHRVAEAAINLREADKTRLFDRDGPFERAYFEYSDAISAYEKEKDNA